MLSFEYNATVKSFEHITESLGILRVIPDTGVPQFRAGQYLFVGLEGSEPRLSGCPPDPDGTDTTKFMRAAYSIASSPNEYEYIEFYIILIPQGRLSPRVFALLEGSRLYVAPKPLGAMTLDGVPDTSDIVLIATGTGIGPYMSMVDSIDLSSRSLSLVHGVRHSSELGYRQKLEKLSKSNRNFTYVPLVSREPEWGGLSGRIQTLWNRNDRDEVLGLSIDKASTHLFLCGNPKMVESMRGKLIEEGFTKHNKLTSGQIHEEEYW